MLFIIKTNFCRNIKIANKTIKLLFKDLLIFCIFKNIDKSLWFYDYNFKK